MQTVKHHVVNSENTTIRGYFSSEATQFDPGSDSLRENIKKEKAKIIYDLASGATGDAEEDEIRDRIVASENSYEIIRMFGAIDGWPGLDDELPEGHLDPIAAQLAQVLDQRDYPVYQLIRRYLTLLDYDNSPNLGDCIDKLLTWPKQFQAAEIDQILGQKPELLRRIASAAMRQRVNMTGAALVHPDVIQRVLGIAPHRRDDLVSLMHEVNYTTRICHELARLNFQPLYAVLTDMVDPNPPMTNLQRVACRDSCKRLHREFAAARDSVDVAGSNEAKATINRFMTTLKTAIDNFPTNVPSPGVVGQIAAAIGAAAASVEDLRTAILNLPDLLAGALSLPKFLDSNGDDLARALVSKLQSQQTLAHTSWHVKIQMINALLSGSTDDDDEIAINAVMRTAKAHDQAEVYQLAAAATWESLYTSMNGDEYDELENILNMPI
ncbi:hypothetical protein [Rhodococcus sp. M8-35]|uniref:hypothetical protein n=1 Tax=Rhodococcus sp. M8-35 TaxID=3058401 RepID=UPI002ED2F6A5